MNEKCQNCKCFLKSNSTTGTCRRYPPKSSSSSQRTDGIAYEHYSDFVWVDNINWCGEWRPK